MGDDGLLSTSREHHLEQKPLKYLKMRPGISPVHMSAGAVEHDSQLLPCRAGQGWLAGWGVSRSVSPGPEWHDGL